MEDELVTELTSAECWAMLRAEEFGRLAFGLVDEIHIAPVNYVVDGDSLLFRSAEGNKLLAVALGSEVAFEIDRYDEEKQAASSYGERHVCCRRTRRITPTTCRCGHGCRP